MTSRILPSSEWSKLAGTEADEVWRTLPAHAQVLVVEDDGAIAGCWILLPVLHVECLYIAPTHRKRSSVGRRLLAGMARLVREAGGSGAWTSAQTPDVEGLLGRAGATVVPGAHYLLSFGG